VKKFTREHPRLIHKLHYEKVGVWCALNAQDNWTFHDDTVYVTRYMNYILTPFSAKLTIKNAVHCPAWFHKFI
jgi:hypothetical protein